MGVSARAWLSDSEVQEFDHITYEKICEMEDANKLKRLERYMREEGFPQTAEVAKRRLVEKEASAHSNNTSSQVEDDLNIFLKDFESWKVCVKNADERLKELHQSKISNFLVKENDVLQLSTIEPSKIDKSSVPMHSIRNQHDSKHMLPSILVGEDTKSCNKHKNNDIRSGRDYYEMWDRYASKCEREIIEEESKKSLSDAKEKLKISSFHDVTNNKQRRNLTLECNKSEVEKEWLAHRAREKGNELFKAKEYNASIEAYTTAIEMFPKHGPAYANRAAAYIKLNRWDDVYKDCSMALEIDPKYVKALMRRSLASLESDNPDAAIADLEAALNLHPTNQEIIQLRQKAEHELLKHRSRCEIKQGTENKQKEVLTPSTNNSNPVGSRRILIEEVDESDKVSAGSGIFDHREEALSTDDISIKEMCSTTITSFSLKADVTDNLVGQTKQHPCKPTSTDMSEYGSSACLNTASASSEQEKEEIQSLETPNLQPMNMPKIIGNSFDPFENNPNGKMLVSDVSRPAVGITSSDRSKPEEKTANELCLRGNKQFTMGDLEAAEESYSNSIKKNRQSAAAFANRALCRIQLQNFEGAVQDSSKALSIERGYWKAYYYRGSALQALGRLEEALEDMKKVLEFHPGEKHVLARKDSLQKQLDEASFIPMRMGPMIIEEVEGLGIDLATETLSKAGSEDHKQSAEQLRFEGNEHFHSQQYTESIDCYNKSINLNPAEAKTFANRSLCYMKVGDLNQAKKDCTEAIRLNPGYSKAYFRRSSINEKLGDLQSALNDVQEMQAFLPCDMKVKAKIKELKKCLAFQAAKASNRTFKCAEAKSSDASKINIKPGATSHVTPMLPPLMDTCNGDITFPRTPNSDIATSCLGDFILSEESSNSKKVQITAKISTPAVLPSRPKTALEFERACSRTQHDPNMLRDYIKSIELSKYPTIFKDSLSANIMRILLEALQNSFMPDDAPGAMAVLHALVKVKRFKLVVMLLSPEVKKTLLLVMEWITSSDIAPVELLHTLKSNYRL